MKWISAAKQDASSADITHKQYTENTHFQANRKIKGKRKGETQDDQNCLVRRG